MTRNDISTLLYGAAAGTALTLLGAGVAAPPESTAHLVALVVVDGAAFILACLAVGCLLVAGGYGGRHLARRLGWLPAKERPAHGAAPAPRTGRLPRVVVPDSVAPVEPSDADRAAMAAYRTGSLTPAAAERVRPAPPVQPAFPSEVTSPIDDVRPDGAVHGHRRAARQSAQATT